MHYCFKDQNSDTLFVISPGRNESGIKYSEVSKDIITKLGASTLQIDHINQGFSTHTIPGTDKVHIENFEDYFTTTEEVILKILSENPNIKTINVVAHSMGSYIIHEVAKRGKIHFDNLYLSAPMYGISTRGIPMPLARFLASATTAIGLGEYYAFFQGPYKKAPFSLKNLNTRNEERYYFSQTVYDISPELKSAGATFGWVNAVLKQTKDVAQNLSNLDNTKVYLFQSQADKVVDNDVQNEVCNNLKSCTKIIGKDAYHDFIHENNDIREQMYKVIGL